MKLALNEDLPDPERPTNNIASPSISMALE